MKAIALSAILLATCAAQVRNDPTPKLNCENQDWNGNSARHCEMREQTIAFPGQLTVDGRPNGGISVRGWNRTDVLIRMRVETRGATDAEAKALASQVRPSISAGRISSEGPSATDKDRNWSVSYEIFTPYQSNLDITSQNGGVHLQDLRGNIQFSTVNGGVHMSHVDGNVKGGTTNGGLHIELAGSRWEGQGMDVHTTNGGVHMQIPSTYSAQLDASTSNGGLHLDFNAPEAALKARHVQTTIGSGGAPIRVTTTNGGVHVQKI
jgi:hypothetical protein